MAHQATAPSPPRLSLSALRVLGQGTFGRVWRMHCDAAPPSWGPGLAGSFLAVKEMWLNAFVGEPKELNTIHARNTDLIAVGAVTLGRVGWSRTFTLAYKDILHAELPLC